MCRFYGSDDLIDIILLFIKNGIQVNCQNNAKWNALHLLCRYYQNEKLIDIVRLLIELKIDVNCQTDDGVNALHFLCGNYHKKNLIDIIRLLIDGGIDVNCQTDEGRNVLHFLCGKYTGSNESLTDIIRLLAFSQEDENVWATDSIFTEAQSFLLKRYNKNDVDDIIKIRALREKFTITVKYDHNKILGGGGFGIVFHGVWGKRRVPVAVKRVHLLDAESKDIKREEENLQKLKEKPDKIVQLFHVHQDDDFRYSTEHYTPYTMEALVRNNSFLI